VIVVNLNYGTLMIVSMLLYSRFHDRYCLWWMFTSAQACLTLTLFTWIFLKILLTRTNFSGLVKRLRFKVGLSGRGVLGVPSLSSSLMLILSYFTVCGGVQLMQLLMMCCGICGMLFLEIRLKIILWCGKKCFEGDEKPPTIFRILVAGYARAC
jgi:hypothetical protein